MAGEGVFLKDPRKQRALLTTLVVSGFTTMLNTSTVNIALPTFMQIFNTDIRMVQWIIVGYMLTLGMTLPMVGYFGERYTYRRVYLTALVVMGICAICCVFCNTIYTLIIFRMLKGIAAGFITPCTMTLLYMYIPREKQAGYLGLSVMANSLGPTIGPTIAGFLLSVFNWHSLFLVNVPLVAVAFFLAYGSVPKGNVQDNGRLDFKGIVIVAVGTALILVAFTKVEDWGWVSAAFWVTVLAGIILIAFFMRMEYQSQTPLLNFKVFRYKPFAMTILVTCTMQMTFTIMPLLMAVYLQTIQGHTPLEAGLILCLPAMCMVAANYISRLLIKSFTNKTLIIGGLLIAVCGNFAMSRVGVSTGVFWIIFFMGLRYFGIGLVNMPLTDYGMSIIPIRLSGHASSMLSWCRQLSSVIWLSMLTALLSFLMAYHYTANGNVGAGVEGSAAYNFAQMQAVNDVFFTLVLALLLTVFLAMFIKNQKPCRDCEPTE